MYALQSHIHRPPIGSCPRSIQFGNDDGTLAYTSREQTAYFAKVSKKDVPVAIEIISDILLNSKLDTAAIDRERDVILREMEEVNKNQEELVLDHLHTTAFQQSSLGRTILGSEQNIRSLTREQLVDYIQTKYTAPRMVVAGAGAIEHTQLCELADQHFVSMEPAVFTGSDYRMLSVRTDRQHSTSSPV